MMREVIALAAAGLFCAPLSAQGQPGTCQCNLQVDTFPQTNALGTIKTTAACSADIDGCTVSGTITWTWTPSTSTFTSGWWTNPLTTIDSPAYFEEDYGPLDHSSSCGTPGSFQVCAEIEINGNDTLGNPIQPPLTARRLWFCETQ